MQWIGRAWRGEERLWKVCWLYGPLVGIILIAASTFAKSTESKNVILFYYVVHTVLLIWFMVAQWRCAFNADWRIWGYIIRVLTVLSAIGFVLSTLMSVIGLSIIDQSKITAVTECRKEMVEFAEKNGADPQQYVAQNKAYFKECVEFKIKNKTGQPSP